METKKNKSLSSRVKRRNKAGFKGVSNYSYKKTTLYGDYTNPVDNNKVEKHTAITEAIAVGVKYYHRHVGSKPYKKLIAILHDFCNPKKSIFDIIEEKKKS